GNGALRRCWRRECQPHESDKRCERDTPTHVPLLTRARRAERNTDCAAPNRAPTRAAEYAGAWAPNTQGTASAVPGYRTRRAPLQRCLGTAFSRACAIPSAPRRGLRHPVRMQRELLYAPIQQLARPDFVFRHTRECVHPAELARFATRRAELPDELAIECELLHLTREHRIRIDILGLAGRDADRIRPERGVLAVLPLPKIRYRRHPPRRLLLRRVVPDLTHVVQIVVEDLDPAVRTVGHVHDALVVHRDAVRRAELQRPAATLRAHVLDDVSVLVELVDGRVPVAVAVEEIPLRFERDVGRLGEIARARWR